MSISVKAGVLFDSAPALQEFSATKGLPAKLSFRIATKVLRRAEEVVREFVDARNKLFQEHGTKIEAGPNKGAWEVKKDSPNRAAFEAGIKELEEEIVEFSLDTPIRCEDLGDKVDIAPGVFVALSWLIVE